MKKLLGITLVVLMCLTAATTMAENPNKCEIPNATPGAFEVPGLGFGNVTYFHPEKDSQTITVLGTKKVPGIDENGKETEYTMYRFDGQYDNIWIFCGRCQTGHHISEFPIPELGQKNMLVEVDKVKCK